MAARNRELRETVKVRLPGGFVATVSAEMARRRGLPLVQNPEATQEKAPESDPRPTAAEVRAWASENDVECPTKGRVPAAVYEAYQNAHQ